MSSPDKVSRGLAATALGVGLVALVLAVYAVYLGNQYLDDVRVLGESLESLRGSDHDPAPLHRPPVQLEIE